MKKNYYMFKMNTTLLSVLSLILIVLAGFVFYLIYGSKSGDVFNNSFDMVMLTYIPYLLLHELLHSISYVIHGASIKYITYGIHLEKGIMCCLCKQNINKKNILFSLMSPFVYLGLVTLIIGLVFSCPTLVILSLANITGCTGDFIMFYHLSRLKDYEFSEYDDPVAFGLYTKNDFSKLKMFGLTYVGKKSKLQRNDLTRVVISNTSLVLIILYYGLMLFSMLIR